MNKILINDRNRFISSNFVLAMLESCNSIESLERIEKESYLLAAVGLDYTH